MISRLVIGWSNTFVDLVDFMDFVDVGTLSYSGLGMALTEREELLRLEAYQDVRGIWTIGWGHTRGVCAGMTCDRDQAIAWSKEDVAAAERNVKAHVAVAITQDMYDALVDFDFNLGDGNLDHSTLLRLVNERDWNDAAGEFENVAVAGFKNGQTISEPSQVGWGITWLNSTFIDDAVGLNYTIAHENDKCIGCSFLLNGTNISLADGSELSLIGGSQDSASTCGVSMIGSAELHATDIHWENLSQTNMQYVCGAPASTLDIHGGSASDDSNSGSTSQNWFTSGFISVDGMQLNSGGRTLTGRVFNVICFIGGVCRVHETANLANTSGVDALGVFGGGEVGAPSSFQNGNQDWCYFDSTSHALMCSYNASAFGVVPLLNRANTWSALQSGSVGAYGQVVASGTATMTTAAIASGACGSTVLVSATGVLTTDSISVAANAAVGTPNGLLTLNYWVTANNVNFAYCNPTASSQTPVAETLNWRVSR